MRRTLKAVFQKDGEVYTAYCPEVPGASDQGRTIEECRESLIEAVKRILGEDSGPASPPDSAE